MWFQSCRQTCLLQPRGRPLLMRIPNELMLQQAWSWWEWLPPLLATLRLLPPSPYSGQDALRSPPWCTSGCTAGTGCQLRGAKSTCSALACQFCSQAAHASTARSRSTLTCCCLFAAGHSCVPRALWFFRWATQLQRYLHLHLVLTAIQSQMDSVTAPCLSSGTNWAFKSSSLAAPGSVYRSHSDSMLKEQG